MYNMEGKLQKYLPFINSNNQHGSQKVLSKTQVIDLKQKARLKIFPQKNGYLFLQKILKNIGKRVIFRLIDKTDTLKLINGQSKSPLRLNFRD